MDIKKYASLMADRVEDVVRHLYPDGKKKGNEWCVGDVDGSSGASLKIHLSGGKAGIFCDFANPEQAGDLIELWRLKRNLTTFEALKEVKTYLGLKDPEFVTPKKKRFKPVQQNIKIKLPTSKVTDYLQGRGISEKTMRDFLIGEMGNVIAFPYKREEELYNVKYLKLERDERGKKVTWQEKNAMPCLFGWQALPESARSVCLTEGEIDAMTMHEYGFPSLSIPMGGGAGDKHSWIEYEWSHLERFDTIYLLMDNDETGNDSIIDLIDRLGRHRCHIVKLPFNDANDCLRNGMTSDAIKHFIHMSETYDPEELRGAIDFLPDVINEFYPTDGMVPGFDPPFAAAKDKLRFRYAEVSTWTGINSHGKSQCLGHVTVAGIAQGEKFCIASLELKPAKLLRRMTIQAKALKKPSIPEVTDTLEWFDDRVWMFDLTGTAKAAKILSVFEYARKRYGIRQFVIDSLMKCGIAEDDYKGQKEFVEALCDFVNIHNCHIHLVAHSRKHENESKIPNKLDVKGTGAITDLAHNCFTIWRNKAKEEKVRALMGRADLDKDQIVEAFQKLQHEPDVLFLCDKQREGDWEGKIPLYFDMDSYQYLDHWDDTPKDYVKEFLDGLEIGEIEDEEGFEYDG